MRLLRYLLMVMMLTSSCKKDDDPTSENFLIGKWYQKKSVSTSYQNGKRGFDEVDTNFSQSDFLDFKTTGEVVNGQGVKSTYILSGSTLKITPTGSSSEKQQFDVITLTASHLEIAWDYDLEMKNGVVVYKERTELTFSKGK